MLISVLKWPVLYHILKTIPNEWTSTWNFVVPRLCQKSKLVSWIFFADRQKFILSCVMQSTWNKSWNANIVYCVQYLEKRCQRFKICLNDMMSWYQTWSLHYRQRFAWYLWSLSDSWCLMQLLATSMVVQFLTNQLKLSKLITIVIRYLLWFPTPDASHKFFIWIFSDSIIYWDGSRRS